MPRIRIDLDLPPDLAYEFQRKAILAGYMRTDPSKRWSRTEFNEAVREGIKLHVMDVLSTIVKETPNAQDGQREDAGANSL